MQDQLAIIKRIIDEHQTIKGYMKLAGDSVSDQEALNALHQAHADFIPGRPEAITERQKRVQQTMSALGEGLRNHFAFEEKALPPMLGELLTRALVLEHREIIKEIDDARSQAASTVTEGLSRGELLLKESNMQQMIERISRLVDEHAGREEAILEMLRKALEK